MISCTNCSTGKRKCSRELPSCKRCQKLNKECIYPSMKPKYKLLENKISSIEMKLDSIKDKFKNTGKNEIYNKLCAQYFISFGASIPFIRYERIQSLLLIKCQNSALINALCIQPYQIELRASLSNTKKVFLEDNPFYQKAEQLLSLLLEDFSLETIQALVLIAFFECGAGLLNKSSIHLAQAVKKAQVLNLDQSEFKRLTPDSDLQAEYIATWSACCFTDNLAYTFFYCPKIISTLNLDEETLKDINDNSFNLPNFEIDGITYSSKSSYEYFADYIDEVIKGLNLQFQQPNSRFLLNSIAYKKASLLAQNAYKLNKQFKAKDLSPEKFKKLVLHAINLLLSLTPKNLNSDYLLSVSRLDDLFVYHYISLWFTIKGFLLYLMFFFSESYHDSDLFNSKANNIINEVFLALDHPNKEIWKSLEENNYFIASFSLLTVAYFTINSKLKVENYQNVALKYIYNGLIQWPVLLCLSKELFNGDLDQAKDFLIKLFKSKDIKIYLE